MPSGTGFSVAALAARRAMQNRFVWSRSPVLVYKECVRIGGHDFGLSDESSFSRDLLQLGTSVASDLNHWEPVRFLDSAHHRENRLHRHGARFDEVGLHQRQELTENLSRTIPVIIQRETCHFRHLAGNFI